MAVKSMDSRIAVLLAVCVCSVWGQNRTLEATVTASYLYSPGYPDGLNYGANTTMDYLVFTNYENHTLSMEVTDCEMEADKNGACYYDQLYVYDGANSSATLLETFCCSTGSNPTWTTTTKYGYFIFTTDANNNFKGFAIRLLSDGITTTTSTTSTSTTSTTTTSTTTPTPATAATGSSSEEGGSSNTSTYIIAGSAVGGLLLLILIIVVVVCVCMKKSSSNSTSPQHTTKRVLWSRANTIVQPMDASSLPPGTVTQTNVFDLELPGGRNNLLPPLSSKMHPPPGPIVEAAMNKPVPPVRGT